MIQNVCGSVLGIDIGCTPTRRSSAVYRLDWSETTVTWRIERFRAVEPERGEVIRKVAGSVSLTAAAFDGPLRSARRGDRSDAFFQHLAGAGVFHRLVEHCLTGRSLGVHPSTVANHDDRAALVCALTALSVAAGDFVAVGDDDGWIILPPLGFVQPWALELLKANAAGEGKSVLHVSRGSTV